MKKFGILFALIAVLMTGTMAWAADTHQQLLAGLYVLAAGNDPVGDTVYAWATSDVTNTTVTFAAATTAGNPATFSVGAGNVVTITGAMTPKTTDGYALDNMPAGLGNGGNLLVSSGTLRLGAASEPAARLFTVRNGTLELMALNNNMTGGVTLTPDTAAKTAKLLVSAPQPVTMPGAITVGGANFPGLVEITAARAFVPTRVWIITATRGEVLASGNGTFATIDQDVFTSNSTLRFKDSNVGRSTVNVARDITGAGAREGIFGNVVIDNSSVDIVGGVVTTVAPLRTTAAVTVTSSSDVRISGSGVATDGIFVTPAAGTATGTFTIRGGTVTLRAQDNVAVPVVNTGIIGAAVVSMDGGTLNINNGGAIIEGGGATRGSLTVNGGTVVVNNVGAPGVTTTINVGGTLTINGVNGTFGGATTVNSGTLNINANGAGAVFALNGTPTINVGTAGWTPPTLSFVSAQYPKISFAWATPFVAATPAVGTIVVGVGAFANEYFAPMKAAITMPDVPTASTIATGTEIPLLIWPWVNNTGFGMLNVNNYSISAGWTLKVDDSKTKLSAVYGGVVGNTLTGTFTPAAPTMTVGSEDHASLKWTYPDANTTVTVSLDAMTNSDSTVATVVRNTTTGSYDIKALKNGTANIKVVGWFGTVSKDATMTITVKNPVVDVAPADVFDTTKLSGVTATTNTLTFASVAHGTVNKLIFPLPLKTGYTAGTPAYTPTTGTGWRTSEDAAGLYIVFSGDAKINGDVTATVVKAGVESKIKAIFERAAGGGVTPSGSGGGCNTGYLPFIVLLAAPLFFLRKKD